MSIRTDRLPTVQLRLIFIIVTLSFLLRYLLLSFVFSCLINFPLLVFTLTNVLLTCWKQKDIERSIDQLIE